MPNVDVYNLNREKVGQVVLDDTVFAGEVKEHLLYAAVRYQLAKRRAGTHKVKGRAEVSGGGRKPFRQKGTGRARAGTTRAPHMRGGGVVHGPIPRSHAFKLNKSVRRAALLSALARRIAEEKVVVLDSLEFAEIKTRQIVDFLKRFELGDALIVLGGRDETVERSSRNLSAVTVVPPEGLNVYDILRRNNLVLTQSAVDAITARLGA
jgi:large subunit ribosomal protein L4